MNQVRNHQWAVFLASMLLTVLVIDYIVGPPPPQLLGVWFADDSDDASRLVEDPHDG